MEELQAIKHNSLRRYLTVRNIIVVALTLLIIGGGLLVFLHSTKKPNLNNVTVITNDVGRHYLLPTNEQPALATITDKSKLTSSLFSHAKNGDKVLIYQTNKIAIIYRPSIDRIISVGPVVIDTPPNGTNSTGN